MNGLAISGSHGLFSHPAKAIGSIFSLKNIVPDITTVAGAALGSVVGGPVGFAVGAGLGETAGEKIEGKSWGQSLESGVEAGTLAYGGEELYGAAGAAAAGEGAATGAGTGTMLGNAINTAGADLGLAGAGGGTILGNLVNQAGGYLLGSGISAPGAAANMLGNTVSESPSMVSALTSGSEVGLGTGALGGAGGIGATGAVADAAGAAGAAAPWYSTGNLIKDAIGLAPTALSLLRGNQPVKGENQVNSAAQQYTQQGQVLQNYLTSGTLPPGVQASINQATAAAQAAIRSQYAAMGMTGSSSEAQELAGAQMQGVNAAVSYAQQLLQTGLSESEFGTQMYGQIMNDNIQKDADLGSAITNFATAMIPGNTTASTSPTAGAASSTASANTG